MKKDLNRGIIFALSSSILSTILAFSVHNSSHEGWRSNDLLIVRGLIMSALSLGCGWRHLLQNPWPSPRVVGRALLGAGSLGASFHAFQVTDPAQVVTVQATLPLIMACVSGRKASWFAAFFLTLGAMLFGVSHLNYFDPHGLLWSCAAVVLASGAFMALGASTEVPAMVVIFWLAILTAVTGMLLGGRVFLVLSHLFDRELINVGVLSVLVQWTLTQSFRNIGTQLATGFAQMSVFWATGYEMFRGGRSDSALILIGMLFMIFGLYKMYRWTPYLNNSRNMYSSNVLMPDDEMQKTA